MKTLSEIATLSFIRKKTSIPVPAVNAYSADSTNELGFEWILMDRVHGRPLEDVWESMSSYITHQDLSVANILVDEKGELTGIIDRENTVAAPRWQACKIPRFLVDGTSSSPPDPLTEEESQDEEAVEAHEEELFEYEQTQLRRFFLEETTRMDPAWVATYNASATRRDVMGAMESLYDEMRVKCVRKWMDCVAEGRTPKMSLFEAVMDPFDLPKDCA